MKRLNGLKMLNKKIYVAGSGGMVGSAIKRNLENKGYDNLICKTSKELNLINQSEVENFFSKEKPEIVIMAAAKVGGILANTTFRAEFIYNNLMIESNVIHASYKNSVEKLIFLGSSCAYPKLAPQPMKEEILLSGYLEETNELYAIAKIAGIKLCESYYSQYGCNFFSASPCNLYGGGDNFDLQTSHVIPSLIRKFHEAKSSDIKEVIVWGTGKPRREFLFVDDSAEAIIFLLENVEARDIYQQGIAHINVGAGEDVEISELASLISEVVGYKGDIKFDTSKPDGMMRKLLDVSQMTKLGWKYKTSLKEGIEKTYQWFLNSKIGEPAKDENYDTVSKRHN
jgi:GDP-L-fucose synthase